MLFIQCYPVYTADPEQANQLWLFDGTVHQWKEGIFTPMKKICAHLSIERLLKQIFLDVTAQG